MTESLISLSPNKDPILLLVTSEWINGTSKDPNLFTSNNQLIRELRLRPLVLLRRILHSASQGYTL